jgi:hypothetical protein
MRTLFGLTDARLGARCRLLAPVYWFATLVCAAPALAGPTDHVLLIDNTIATGKVDVERRLRDGTAEFVRTLPNDDRLAIVLYDDLATPIAPLTKLGGIGRAELIDALNALTFSSSLANPAAGLERAIYELSSQHRSSANSRIVMVQASRLRTGNREQDVAYRTWVEKVLIDRASKKEIPVDVISLGATADLEFGKQIAARTGGLHLALAATDRLSSAFTELETTRRSAGAPSPSRAGAAGSEALLGGPGPRLGDTDGETTAGATPRGYDPSYEQAIADIDRVTRRAPPRAGGPATERRATGEEEQRPAPTNTPGTHLGTGEHQTGKPLSTGFVAQLTHHQVIAAGLAAPLLLGMGGGLYLVRRRRTRRDTHRAGFEPGTRQQIEPQGRQEVRLVDLSGASGKDVYVLDGRLARICRDAGQDTFNVVCITIPDDVISREHALIECRRGRYWIIDPGSNNGTFVNGERVRGSFALQNGDRLRFATFEFLFQEYVASATSLAAGSRPAQAPAVDPMKTEIAPRPLALVCDSEDRTIANTVAYRPTANDDPSRPVRRTVDPKT